MFLRAFNRFLIRARSPGGVRMPFSGLFLEGVQNVHHAGEFHGVNSSIGAALVIHPDFEDAGTAEALERFGGDVLGPVALGTRAKAHYVLYLRRELPQVISTAGDPEEGLRIGGRPCFLLPSRFLHFPIAAGPLCH